MRAVSFALLACSVVGSASLALGAPDPAALDAVVSECEVVAGDHSLSEPATGPCVTAAKAFLASRIGGDAGAFDQGITDMVTAIAPMSQDEICDIFDQEMASAVQAAADASRNQDQADQLRAIAATLIEDCDAVQTAAVVVSGA